MLEYLLRHLLHLYLTSSAPNKLLPLLHRIANNPPIPRVPLSMRATLSPILPRLYLSGITAASSPSALESHHITHVLSIVTPSEAPSLPSGLKHMIVPIADTTTAPLLSHLPAAVAFLAEALEDEGARVLVHCVEGVSRSASVVIAFLMAEREMSFATALRVVKRRRQVVCPNLGFVRQLSQWAERCGEFRVRNKKAWEVVLEEAGKRGERRVLDKNGGEEWRVLDNPDGEERRVLDQKEGEEQKADRRQVSPPPPVRVERVIAGPWSKSLYYLKQHGGWFGWEGSIKKPLDESGCSVS